MYGTMGVLYIDLKYYEYGSIVLIMLHNFYMFVIMFARIKKYSTLKQIHKVDV